jgi:hypothetical protein
MTDKIELQAIYMKTGEVVICDQEGRRFECQEDSRLNYDQSCVLVQTALEAPRWPTDLPHAEITFRVPLQVEERLPDWMRQFFDEVQGHE